MSDDAIKERFNSLDKSIEVHEKRINNLEKTYQVMEKMEYRMDQIEKAVAGIDAKLDEAANDKGRKWDKLIDYLFYFVIAAILSYVAANIGG
jgi:tetrahydromethanopterin S-methyltransferase subunit G